MTLVLHPQIGDANLGFFSDNGAIAAVTNKLSSPIKPILSLISHLIFKSIKNVIIQFSGQSHTRQI